MKDIATLLSLYYKKENKNNQALSKAKECLGNIRKSENQWIDSMDQIKYSFFKNLGSSLISLTSVHAYIHTYILYMFYIYCFNRLLWRTKLTLRNFEPVDSRSVKCHSLNLQNSLVLRFCSQLASVITVWESFHWQGIYWSFKIMYLLETIWRN